MVNVRLFNVFSHFAVQLIVIASIIPLEECKNVTDRYEYHLGTKTPYRFVANIDDAKVQFPECNPQKIWMVVRHGTRNPSSSFIEKMKERLPEIRDLILENNQEPGERLRNSDLYAFKKWKTKLEETDHKTLAHEGEDEMIELAERMQARFPTLFPSVYSNTSYFFKYTATQRTRVSAKYFAAGLFGRHVVRSVSFPKPSNKDPILRFYKLCDKWKSQVKNNPKSTKERRLFEASRHMFNALESMNEELNLDSDLSLDDIYLMYMACGFETSWNRKRRSPWCSAFPLNTLKAVEYADNLKYYYRDGYGYEVNYKQACPMFKDIVHYFESQAKNPTATVYFTHSGTILKLLAHLGLYKDAKVLTHSNYEDANRKWSISKIDSFASNIAFVLFKCGTKQKVAVLHQERWVKMPKCGGNLCDFSMVKKYYNQSINNCSFEQLCENS